MICYTTIQRDACCTVQLVVQLKSTVNNDPSETFNYADLGCKNHYFENICCLIFLWKKKKTFFRIIWWIESLKPQLFVIETCFNFVNVFIVTSDQFNAETNSYF